MPDGRLTAGRGSLMTTRPTAWSSQRAVEDNGPYPNSMAHAAMVWTVTTYPRRIVRASCDFRAHPPPLLLPLPFRQGAGDLGGEEGAAVDQAGVELHQRRARIHFLAGRRLIHDAADADDGQAA